MAIELKQKSEGVNIVDRILGYGSKYMLITVNGIDDKKFVVFRNDGKEAGKVKFGKEWQTRPKKMDIDKGINNIVNHSGKTWCAGFITSNFKTNEFETSTEKKQSIGEYIFEVNDKTENKEYLRLFEEYNKKAEKSDKKTKSISDNRGREEYVYFYRYEEVEKDPAKIKLIGMELEDKTNVFIEDEDAHEDVLKPFRFKDLLKGVKKTDQETDEEEKIYETDLFEMTVSLFDFMDEEKKKKIEEIENKVNKKEETNQNESRVITYYSRMRRLFEAAGDNQEEKKNLEYNIVFQKPKVNHGISAVRMKIENLQGSENNKLANKRLYIGNDIRKEIIKRTNEFFKDYEGILKLQDNINNIKIDDFDIEKLNKDIEKFTESMEQSVKNINEILYRGYLEGESSLDDPMHVKFRDITRKVVKEKYKQIINSDKLKELKKIGFNDNDLDLSNENKRIDYNK